MNESFKDAINATWTSIDQSTIDKFRTSMSNHVFYSVPLNDNPKE